MREQRSLSTGRTERWTSGTGMKFVHSMKGSFLSLENKSFYCWDLNLYKKQVYLFFTILFYPQKTYFREELSWVKNKSRTVKSRIFRNFHLKHTFLNIGWTWKLQKLTKSSRSRCGSAQFRCFCNKLWGFFLYKNL